MARDAAVADARRLPGLELLRLIAALCVLFLHIQVIFGQAIFGQQPVFARGYLGVDLFFMLSGYVMARSFAHAPPTGQNPARFMFDRYARMWPMMALGGVIGLAPLWLRVPDLAPFLGLATANLLLLPVAFRGQAYPLDVPAWTILFILLGNLLHRVALVRWRGPALAFGIAISIVMMSAVAVYAGSFNVGSRPNELALALPRLLLGYLIGMALYRAWGNTPPLAVPPLLALAAMPVLVVGAWWGGVTSWLFDLAFVTIACPLMIAGAMRLRIGARWPGFAGAWSFPLYAIHFPVLIRLRMAGATAWQAGAGAVVLSALVTWLEMQLRRRLKRAGGWRAMLAGMRPAIIKPILKDTADGAILYR